MKKPLKIKGLSKLMTGIEPVTSALPMRRTTDCATSAYEIVFKLCQSVSAHYQCDALPTVLYQHVITHDCYNSTYKQGLSTLFFDRKRRILKERKKTIFTCKRRQ